MISATYDANSEIRKGLSMFPVDLIMFIERLALPLYSSMTDSNIIESNIIDTSIIDTNIIDPNISYW